MLRRSSESTSVREELPASHDSIDGTLEGYRSDCPTTTSHRFCGNMMTNSTKALGRFENCLWLSTGKPAST